MNPDLVMVWLGQNDSEFSGPQYRDGLRQFINRIHNTAPNSEIVLIGSYHNYGPWLPELVAAMQQVASEDGVGFINMFEAGGDYQFFQQSQYLADGVHFSVTSGYLGNVLYNAFATNGASLGDVRSIIGTLMPAETGRLHRTGPPAPHRMRSTTPPASGL